MVMAATSYSALSREVESLEAKNKSLVARNKSAQKRGEVFVEKALDIAGGATAWGTAAVIGLAEGRVRNKDGSPLSLGPVSLGLATAGILGPLSLAFNPGGQTSFAYAGAMACDGVTRGRGWGNAWRAKSASGVGGAQIGAAVNDALTAEEQALLSQVD